MELRHLRYFIAVAEEGSVTLAAERRLFTSQPSLSRQLKDLEDEVGTQLMVRSPKGVELTPAGRAFLEHARLALAQVDAARDAARRAGPSTTTFALGFLTGEEVAWMGKAMKLLRTELPRIEVTISSQHSPYLAEGLVQGKLDAAFLRAEENMPELEFIPVSREPLRIIMPSDHPLAESEQVDIKDIANEVFIGLSDVATPLRRTVERYLADNGLDIQPTHRVDNLTQAMSLVSSTRGVALLPSYAEAFLPWSVTSRHLAGETPSVQLCLGYRRSSQSPILRYFLSHLAEISEVPEGEVLDDWAGSHRPHKA